jgi:hypothetical protein
MNTFYAQGESYSELISCETDEVIGHYYAKRPHFSIECETIEEAIAAPLEAWSFEGDSGGPYEFFDWVDPNEVEFYNQNQIITDIYFHTIE